jgi:Secretion system C-terminal sorting domain/Pregnancy-associated plasma protein-A
VETRHHSKKRINNNYIKSKKMKLKIILLPIVLSIFCLTTTAQSEKCVTMKHLAASIAKDPSLLTRIQQAEIRTQEWIATQSKVNPKTMAQKVQQVVTIPVVVHVIWNDPIENISEAQIQSQIDVLNEDFRLLNADSLPPSHPFWPYTADAEIEFCLAARDPAGKATNGITRTYTTVTGFTGDGEEKHTATGGIDNWDPTQYLNLWVCNLDSSGGTLGYAAFPADLAATPEEDGVVIRYEAFGSIGTAAAPNELGRTATHEIGHWLNLRHIWGDAICGDDLVDDTEIQEDAVYGCPAFPHNDFSTCGSGPDGEMNMNFMDYVDDACMNMFTYGQTLRMDAALNGERVGLLTSLGCSAPTKINEIDLTNSIDMYPNPSKGNLIINADNLKANKMKISVYDMTGALMHEFKNMNSLPYKIDLNDLSNGIYYVKAEAGDKTITKKIIISK